MVPLRDELRADDDVEAALARCRRVPRAAARPMATRSLESTSMRASRKQRRALPPPAARRPGPTGDEANSPPGTSGTRPAAACAKPQWWQTSWRSEAVIDQPGVAVRAGEAKAAGAAQRQRRVAAAVEEQQRLLAALDRGLHRLGEPRRDEAAARRAFAREIDRLDRRQRWPPKRSGSASAPVAAAPRIDLGLDRRRRRGQHDRDVARCAPRTTAMSRAW